MSKNDLDKILEQTKQKLRMKPDKVSLVSKDIVMVVDDDEGLIKTLEFVLQQKHMIISCYNGKEAIQKFEKYKDHISAVLLDIKMDGKDGIEVYQELKAINPAVPIIFNTAYPGEYKPLDLMQKFHPFSYIVKGSDPAMLYDNISSAIEYFNLIKDKDRLNKNLQEAIFVLKELHKSSNTINSISNQKRLYKEIIKQIINVFGSQYVIYFSFENYQWNPITSNTIKSKKIKHELIQLMLKIIPVVDQIKTHILVGKNADIKQNKALLKMINTVNYINNLIILPIIINKKLTSLIMMINCEDKDFSQDIYTNVLKMFSNHIAVSLKNIIMVNDKIQNKELLTIGRTAAMIVHDMNNPLHLIKGYVQLMMMDCENEKKGSFNEIITEIDVINTMMDELVEFIKRGSSKINLTKHKFSSIIQGYYKKVKTDYLQDKVRISLKLNYNGFMLLDKDKIGRVLQNILTNARMALVDGGKIIITTEQIDQIVELRISDTGKGIDDTVKNNIFEPFFTHKKTRGLGLGLYIAKQMILQHEGTIDVESKKNHGTTFIIRLPIK